MDGCIVFHTKRSLTFGLARDSNNILKINRFLLIEPGEEDDEENDKAILNITLIQRAQGKIVELICWNFPMKSHMHVDVSFDKDDDKLSEYNMFNVCAYLHFLMKIMHRYMLLLKLPAMYFGGGASVTVMWITTVIMIIRLTTYHFMYFYHMCGNSERKQQQQQQNKEEKEDDEKIIYILKVLFM